MNAEMMWEQFVRKNPTYKEKKYEVWSYGVVPDKLGYLTFTGTKRATASGYDLYAASNEPLPQAGDLSVILDSAGEAICIIKTTQVEVVPFNEVSAEFAYKEGEGDRSLAYWRAVHEEFFLADFARSGLVFTESSLVVCEEFEVVHNCLDLNLLQQFVEEKLGDDTTGHDLNHIKRVENLALSLADQEGMTTTEIITIRAAVLLHDVIDEKLVDDIATAKEGVWTILQKSGASEHELAVIRDTIENMSYSKNLKEKYELTKVGKIVQDADRLDAIGAIGIARTFYYGGSKGHAMYDDTEPFDPDTMDEAAYRTSENVVNHFYEKLLRLEHLMNTQTGKRLARERTAFMQTFLDQLDLEIKGER